MSTEARNLAKIEWVWISTLPQARFQHWIFVTAACYVSFYGALRNSQNVVPTTIIWWMINWTAFGTKWPWL